MLFISIKVNTSLFFMSTDYTLHGSDDLAYDMKKERWIRPTFNIGEPNLEYKQIREDAWQSGDPSLLSKAGSYFQRLFRYQRHEQAKRRKWELKHLGHWENPFLYCYPLHNWFQDGLKLKSFDMVHEHPFDGLYIKYYPRFKKTKQGEIKKAFYYEDIQTLTKFPTKPGETVLFNKYYFLPQYR